MTRDPCHLRSGKRGSNLISIERWSAMHRGSNKLRIAIAAQLRRINSCGAAYQTVTAIFDKLGLN